jgi:hypothetical protein
MTAATLDNQLKQYWPLLEKEEKLYILSHIKSFLAAEESPKRMTKEAFIIQYNKELDEAEAEVKAGHVTSQEDAKKQAESWFAR